MTMNRIISLILASLLVLSVIISGVAVAFSAAPRTAGPSTPVASALISSATALNAATTSAAAAAGLSVVKVESAQGLGSGVIIDAKGYIVTNYHVLSNGTSVVAKEATYTVTLANGKILQARVAGTDAPDDLAVLKVSAANLRALPMADSAALRTGELVLAVGNPLGYAQSVTLGIVSTPRRTVAENGPATFIPDMIQTSAPINPGNSGGALVDLAGRLVGIPTLAATDPRLGTAAQGIGFAIPSNRVAVITQQIIKGGKVLHSGRAYLGLTNMVAVTPDLAERYALPVDHGVLITGLIEDGPAARSGLERGEVLVQLDGKPIADSNAFGEVLASLKPGQRVAVTVYGSNGSHAVTVQLGELPVS
jgi:S1-C subfamily serine protease